MGPSAFDVSHRGASIGGSAGTKWSRTDASDLSRSGSGADSRLGGGLDRQWRGGKHEDDAEEVDN